MTTNAPLTPRLCLTNPRDRYSLLMQPGRRRSSSPYLSTILLVVAPCPAASAASSRRAGIRETKPNPLPRVRGRGQGERMWLLVVQASCLRLSEVQARTPPPQSCNRHLRLPWGRGNQRDYLRTSRQWHIREPGGVWLSPPHR